jgi:hypothetical protein
VLCGVPQNRVGQFNAALGVDNLDDYMELPLADLKGDFETVAKNPTYANVVSIRSIKKCIALRAWGEYMLLRNQDFEAADFDQQYVVWLSKIDKEMESYREAAVTPTLKTSSGWLKFEREVGYQLQTYRSSVLKHSLRYVIRPNAGVSEEALEADYPSLDADLYMTAALAGPQFQADNKHVTELLTAWLGLTDWWTFLCRFAPTKWLALKVQMEGPAAIDARKKKAHLDLTTSYYTGNRKNYTWDDYIRVRQEAHLELELLEAPVDNMRKVDLMFEGVKAEALGPVVLALKANSDYTEDFDGAQQQIKKAIVNMGIEARQAAAQCSISAVGTVPRGNGKRGGGSNKKQKGAERAAKLASSLRNPSVPLKTIRTWKSMLGFTRTRYIALCPRSSSGQSRRYARRRRRTRRTVPTLEPWSSSSLQQPLHPATGWPQTPRKAKVPTSCQLRLIPRRSLTTRALQRMTRTASLPWRIRNRQPLLLVVPRTQRNQCLRKPKSWWLLRLMPSQRRIRQSMPYSSHGDRARAGTSLQREASFGTSVLRKKRTKQSSSGQNMRIGVNTKMRATKDITRSSNLGCSRVVTWTIATVPSSTPA